MGMYRPLRGGIFIYDIIRLFALIQGLILHVSSQEPGGMVFPYLLAIAPNALFPLMAFFLWVSLEAYHPYLFLYISGKLVAIAAALGWCMFSLANQSVSPLENVSGILITLSLTGLVVILDSISILGSVLINRRFQSPLLSAGPLPEAGPQGMVNPQNGGI